MAAGCLHKVGPEEWLASSHAALPADIIQPKTYSVNCYVKNGRGSGDNKRFGKEKSGSLGNLSARFCLCGDGGASEKRTKTQKIVKEGPASGRFKMHQNRRGVGGDSSRGRNYRAVRFDCLLIGDT